MSFAGNTEAFCQNLNSLIFFHFQAKLISTLFCLAPKITSLMPFRNSCNWFGSYSDELAVLGTFCEWKSVFVEFLIVCTLCWRQWPWFIGMETWKIITMVFKCKIVLNAKIIQRELWQVGVGDLKQLFCFVKIFSSLY